MRVVWIVAGGLAGLVAGCVLGIAAALVAMSMGPSRTDGTYGMREMLVCLPSGAILGLIGGLGWAFTTRLAP